MRTRNRHHRAKHRVLAPWPEDANPPAEVASQVRYVGSSEHKGAWAPGFQPGLRSDASECPPELTTDVHANTELLRAAIANGCVGHDFEEGFPKYVWVWVGRELWEARHIRGPTGTYKAYGPLEPVEYPKDPERRLARVMAGSDE